MRGVLKVVLWLVVGLFGLVVLAATAIFGVSEYKLRKTYDIAAAPIVIPTDTESVERGRHLATTWAACTLCHGDRLQGAVLFDDQAAVMIAPNLTAGEGGIGAFYRDQDWVRAIRHGIRPSGRSALVMPETLNTLSDAELGAIIAYLKTVPPVDNVLPNSSVRPFGRLGLAIGLFSTTAELIDHEAPRSSAPEPGPSREYGGHIANAVCVVCHGTDFAGGVKPRGTEAEFPPPEPTPRNLTPAGNLATWTEQDFLTTIRTGVTPFGERLDADAMPWPTFSKLTDDELRALWLFLQSLPAAEPSPED